MKNMKKTSQQQNDNVEFFEIYVSFPERSAHYHDKTRIDNTIRGRQYDQGSN